MGGEAGRAINSLAHKSVCQNSPRASSEPESASLSGWSCWSPASVPPNTTAFPLCTLSRRRRAGSLQLSRTPPRNIFRESCEILSIFIAKVEQQRRWNVGEVCLHVFTLKNFVWLRRPDRAPAGVNQAAGCFLLPSWFRTLVFISNWYYFRLSSWENHVTLFIRGSLFSCSSSDRLLGANLLSQSKDKLVRVWNRYVGTKAMMEDPCGRQMAQSGLLR